MGLIGVSSVKIIKGSKSPLEIHKLKGPEFYCDGNYMGKNGLCNLQIPPTLFDSVLDYSDNFVIRNYPKN